MASLASAGQAAGTSARIRRVKPWRHSPEQCYRLRGWRRWLMWWLFGPLLMTGLLLMASSDAATAVAGAVLLLLPATMLAGWEWLCHRTTLEVTAAGLCLRQVGYRLETPWRNVIGFDARRGREGFVLAAALDTSAARRLAFCDRFAGLHDGAPARWIAERRFIPIEAFGWHLRKGSMAADVSALAPHLAPIFASVDKPAPVTPRQRRDRWAVALFSVALIAASMVLGWTQPAGMTRLVDIAYALATPLLVLQAGIDTWQCLRGRQWFMALLMALWTLVSLCWTVLAWQHVAAPFTA